MSQMPLIDFESARVKEKKRQWEREARNAVLEKAKNKYEAEKEREKGRRQRGEDTWMLPSVEAKLSSEGSKKKKKKKKKKKSKKRKDNSSSPDSDSDENDAWVEKPLVPVPDKSTECSVDKAIDSQKKEPSEASLESSKRDGWMEMTSLFKTYSRDEIKERDGTSKKKEKEEEKRRKQEADKPGSHARELNPYFKNGGTGLPEEQKQKSSASPAVGLDATWLRKALQRAKEQAQNENKTLEEIAAQRWGSLAKFNELLAEAEGRSDGRFGASQKMGKRFGHTRDLDGFSTKESWRRSRERSSRIKERRRSSSKERRRSRSKDRKRSSSRERGRKNKSRDRSPGRGRRRSRSKERGRRRRYSSSDRSSSSSSDSRSSSSSSSRYRSKNRNDSYQKQQQSQAESRHRGVSGMMKPQGYDISARNSGVLSSRFHRPGEESEGRPHACSSSGLPSSSSSRGWQKKGHIQEEQNCQEKPKLCSPSSSSTSSSSESEASEEEPKSFESSGKATVMQTPSVSSEPKVLLTDKEMNELAAKIMKAELIGNDTLANKLKAKLEAARTARVDGSADRLSNSGTQGGSQEEVVLLTRTDARGFSRPVKLTDSDGGRKKKEKTKTHGKDGKRIKYFPDDDKHDLKQMFEEEKTTSAENQNSMFNRVAMQNTEKLNQDYDMDDMFMSKAALKECGAKQAERDKNRAIREHQKSQRSLESCQWCFENKEMPKHLIVALGTKAYVCLPPHQSLTSGHCFIIPVHHVMCAVQADEDLWSEIQNFRKSLVRMFNSRGEDCIFFETVKKLRNYPHMVINCVPLPKEIGDMAPIYFKKAIMECEAEWAQNKKLVDLKNRDVRRAVPNGLPYFFVDFAMDPGYAHVIEDEQDFPFNFAQEIVGGMLDLDNNLWRKPRKENFDAQRRKVMEFSRWYKEFDITQDG